MDEKNSLVVFKGKKIRRTWFNGEWWFSVVDIVGALTESDRARKYWSDLKKRLVEEGFELSAKIGQLKLASSDGKSYLTDCVNTKSAFRIIQSIPSKKAEPFKLWLAKVGYERVQEIQYPELAQDRMKELYEQKGYSKSWIDKLLRGLAVRPNLTDEWTKRGIEKNEDFAILTAEISKATFGMAPNEYKKFKGIEKENLRDHMNDLELIFTMLGEASTAELEKVKNPDRFEEHKKLSKEGGDVAKKARLELESKTKRPIISSENYIQEPEREKRKRLQEPE
ncbi:MAG: Bro-N domain-containing protein [Nanoarchaeota archaeon]|nr:Bro-N domain-containing protein [Nanoarchaeota archaeon]